MKPYNPLNRMNRVCTAISWLGVLGVLGLAGLAGFWNGKYFRLSALSFLAYLSYFNCVRFIFLRFFFYLPQVAGREAFLAWLPSPIMMIAVPSAMCVMHAHPAGGFLGLFGFVGFLGWRTGIKPSHGPKD